MAATALGFREYDKDINIAGVILNKLGSDRHENMIREAMDKIHIPVIGAFRRDDELKTPERHLGLTPVTEIETDTLIQYMKDAADKWINLSMLIKVAQSAPSFEIESIKYNSTSKTVRIGIAKDEAFSFYYPTSLMALEKQGAELIYFSPLRDTKLPDVDGLIFGGGFPEMFLKNWKKYFSAQ